MRRANFQHKCGWWGEGGAGAQCNAGLWGRDPWLVIVAMTLRSSLAFAGFLVAAVGGFRAAKAVTVVYDGLTGTSLTGHVASTDLTRTVGASLNLTSGGKLTELSWSLANPLSFQPTGPILAGTFLIKIYDNTVPYTGGPISAQPLLGSFTANFTFGAGLNPGGMAYCTTAFLAPLNINLTSKVLITQSFTQTAGTSTFYGAGLFTSPTLGSTPGSLYMNGASTPEGLYGGSGGNLGYKVTVVPEPLSVLGLGLGVVGLVRRRRR